MIYAKTVCRKPGSYVTVVPAGLRVSLQYNQNGIIQSIKLLDAADTEVDRDHFSKMIKFTPQKIGLTGGTTWVDGVFYFSDIPTDSGMIPDCCYATYLDRFMSDDCMCAFYAATVKSLAASFGGAQVIRNWISINGFNMLPGTVVPTDFSEATVEMLLQTGAYSFKYPYISGFYIFDGTDVLYVRSNLMQGTVVDISNTLTPEGYVQSAVTLNDISDDKPVVLKLNYSEVVTSSVQVNASILYFVDSSIHVLETRPCSAKTKLTIIDNKITCPVCGKIYYAPAHGPVQCDDPHCLSTAYPQVCRMLSSLDLPELSLDDFRQLIVDKQIITVTDVLAVPPYDSMDITADLVSVLKAAVPFACCTDENVFAVLVDKCQNSVDTLMYYINNPDKMYTELDFTSIAARKFIEWCKDDYNVLTVRTILDCVTVSNAKVPKFEGAPMFRGNVIAITGKFRRGDEKYITSLLEGYSATVVTDFETELPNVVVTGGMCENLNGKMIQSARAASIPVLDEDTFFNTYGIVADMLNATLHN